MVMNNKINVLFHIDEMSKWQLVLSNIKNLIKEMGQDLEIIEVIANSEAVSFYKKDYREFKDKVKDLLENKVLFCACANSLRALDIELNACETYIVLVPSGVAEITRKQVAGFVYIKP